MIDTSRTIEIMQSPKRMRLLLLGGLFMAAACLAIILAASSTTLLTQARHSLFELYIGLIFFGLCSIYIIWRLVTVRGSVVTLAPQGIRDTRIADEFIPWRSIADISTWEESGQRVMVLSVDPKVESNLSLTRMARWTRGPNHALGADGLCVTPAGLTFSYDDLLQAASAYWNAWRNS